MCCINLWGSSLFSVEWLGLSLTPRFSGVEAGWRGISTALAVSQRLEPSAAHRKTAKAVDGPPLRYFTSLKRGVNERGPCAQSTSIPPKTARNHLWSGWLGQSQRCPSPCMAVHPAPVWLGHPSVSSPDTHRSLTVAPLIADKRCYGSSPVSVPGGSAVGPLGLLWGSGAVSRPVPPTGLIHLTVCTEAGQSSPQSYHG